MGYLWVRERRGHKKGRVLFSCHFTTVSFPSESPGQGSAARGEVSPCVEWLVSGREVNLVGVTEVNTRGVAAGCCVCKGQGGGPLALMHSLIRFNMEDALVASVYMD